MNTSVVIPTRNSAPTIGECLSSLMPYYKQGHISEIVVVDAHSTDSTLEIAEDFPVKLLFDEGHGDYIARDIGWRNTGSELVMFIDNDAYLGTGFFPEVHGFFEDDGVGIVGAYERAAVTNQVTRTIGEWWLYHAGNLRRLIEDDRDTWSWFLRLYHSAAWGGEKHVTTSGPCYIARRACLEATNGFECLHGAADILLSRRIIEKGWRATWWLEAPLYHHPPPSSRRLTAQRRFWGEVDAVAQRKSLGGLRKAVLLATRLAAPALGVRLALRYRNPRHLALFPLAQYAWTLGYLGELLRRR